MTESTTRQAAEMVDQAVFEKVFEEFKTRFGGGEGDIVHGLLILKLIVAITEKALDINLKDIEIAIEDDHE